jgi:hypothetical protein
MNPVICGTTRTHLLVCVLSVPAQTGQSKTFVRVCPSLSWQSFRCVRRDEFRRHQFQKRKARGGQRHRSGERKGGSGSLLMSGLIEARGGVGKKLKAFSFRNRPHSFTRDPANPELEEGNPVRQHKTCGARTRSGERCQAPPAKRRTRCRLHGGANGSGAPTGARNGNWRGGYYSREAIAQRRQDMEPYWAVLGFNLPTFGELLAGAKAPITKGN